MGTFSHSINGVIAMLSCMPFRVTPEIFYMVKFNLLTARVNQKMTRKWDLI